MKSIGEHLKTAREEKGFSFDQVVHDTNISREYIHALETDDFDLFPAEAYLIGFLRNYSEYLGLEPSKMVGIYKNFKISEEPVPMDLLLGKKKTQSEKVEEIYVQKKNFPIWIVPTVLVLLIIGGISVIFLPTYLKRDNSIAKETSTNDVVNNIPSGPKEFFLTEETLDIQISNSDKINVSTGSRLFSFSASITSESKSLIYSDLNKDLKKMDLVKDNEQVIIIEENKGVYFFVKEVSNNVVTLIAQKVALNDSELNDGDNLDENSEDIAEANEIIEKKIIITTETYPKAYDIDAFFRGDGLLRYQHDDQPGAERFYQAGERLKIEVNRTATLWISNASIVDVKIAGIVMNMGENGQVVVHSVKWIKNNETGKYELIIVPLK